MKGFVLSLPVVALATCRPAFNNPNAGMCEGPMPRPDRNAAEPAAVVTSGFIPGASDKMVDNIWLDLAKASESALESKEPTAEVTPGGGWLEWANASESKLRWDTLAIVKKPAPVVTSGFIPGASDKTVDNIWLDVAEASVSAPESKEPTAEVTPGGGWLEWANASESKARWDSLAIMKKPDGKSSRGFLTNASQPKKPAVDVTSLFADQIDPALFANAKLPEGMDMLRGNTMWFNSTENFHAFWESQQKPGRKSYVTNPSLFRRDLELLSVEEIPRETVLLLCHSTVPELCHLPLHGQTFYACVGRFIDDGKVENMLFTQHMMNTDCDSDCYPACNPDCGYMHHALDHVLFRDLSVLV